MQAISENRSRINPLQLILLMGLVAGVLDISAAFIDYYIATGNGPGNVLKFIASGVFGMNAFAGNGPMIWWGLGFHFMIAFLFAAFFYWLYPKVNGRRVPAIVTAIVYGLFVWLVMTFVVLPLSHTPKRVFSLAQEMKALVILIFMIGFPLSILMKKYGKNAR